MPILLTGFVPFGKVTTNPSQQIVEQIATSGRYSQVVTAVLPVDYTGGTDCLQQLIDQYQPEAIVCVGEPLAYTSTLPLDRLHTALAAHAIPVEISNHAGAYLCNHVFYMARHLTDTQAIPCGFIHVPGILDETAAEPQGLPLATMVEAIEICLDVLQNKSG